MPSPHERLPDARTPVGLGTPPMDEPDFRYELAVQRTTHALRPRSPSVILRRRLGEGGTQEPDGAIPVMGGPAVQYLVPNSLSPCPIHVPTAPPPS
jgi:hypothetical protein